MTNLAAFYYVFNLGDKKSCDSAGLLFTTNVSLRKRQSSLINFKFRYLNTISKCKNVGKYI